MEPHASTCSSMVLDENPGKNPQAPKNCRKEQTSSASVDNETESACSRLDTGASATGNSLFTHKSHQESYRARVSAFFSDPDNYKRLERLVYHKCEKVADAILHFVVKYSAYSIYATQRADERGTDKWRHYCPRDSYRDALRKYKQRFYNFASRPGHGDIIWDGVRNPRYLVAPSRGTISLPLPKAVAYYWFIDYGFDTHFHEKFKEIYTNYKIFTEQTKSRYTATHKNKKRELRRKAEEEVIEERNKRKREEQTASGCESQSSIKPKQKRRRRTKSARQPTRLTRKERKHVAELMEKKKVLAKEKARLEREKKKKRRSNKAKAGSVAAILSTPRTVDFC